MKLIINKKSVSNTLLVNILLVMLHAFMTIIINSIDNKEILVTEIPIDDDYVSVGN